MEVNEKPITPILRKMVVGEVQEWPVERITSVQVSVGRMHREKRREGVRFMMRTEGLFIKVTRTA